MGEAALWGLVGGSSLLFGAALGLVVPNRPRFVGLALAFGAGTLISALAFELTQEAFERGGADAVTIGLAAGALTYFAGDLLVEGRGAGMRMSPMGEAADIPATALLLGAVLDGIPESAVIGISLLEEPTVSVPVLAAVFLSNLPESLSSASAMRQGHGVRHVLGVWTLVVLVCGAAAAIGYGGLEGASSNTVGLIQAFAAGAVLTMLADTMMPQAFQHGGKAAGLVTVLGFALAFLLSTLE
jgi:ZIP family zinc transporter